MKINKEVTYTLTVSESEHLVILAALKISNEYCDADCNNYKEVSEIIKKMEEQK